MTSRGATTADRRHASPDRRATDRRATDRRGADRRATDERADVRRSDDRRSGGRSVAERALRQIRLVAVALLILGGLGYRPTRSSDVDRDLALVLAGAAAATLLLVVVASIRATKAASGRRIRLVLFCTLADSLVVLGVIAVAGLPPTSLALVLLMLPFLEAAVWFGLSGLAALWTVCSVALGAYVVLLPDRVPEDALEIVVVAMPTLLLATIPVAMLAEHLVAQVGRLGQARGAADDRARLLGDLSAITAEIFPLDRDAVLRQLVAGAEQLGATDVAVVDAGAEDGARWIAGGTPSPAGTVSDDAADVEDGVRRSLAWELPVPGGEPYTVTARVSGPADQVGRHVEALDLLVAQARVGLANAVLVQQLERLKSTYELQATRDQLTGLLNRRGLVARAEQLPGTLGVLFCDLDGFKSVNDTLGHAAGDELLEKVARRLEAGLREDGVLGRMGGDEFVVVLPGAPDEELAELRRRIELEIGRPFLLEAGMARIGVSIGVAFAAPGERDLDALLGQADQRMYEVKRERKSDRAGVRS
jgi:diguanylate cyclase (GGDEF)-like protein